MEMMLGGPGVIVQIDESLFRYKPKVHILSFLLRMQQQLNQQRRFIPELMMKTQLVIRMYLLNAEQQSSWPAQGCFPQLDCPLPQPPISRWGDHTAYSHSQISATTSEQLPANSFLNLSGLPGLFPESQEVAATYLRYASTLLQLQWSRTGCCPSHLHL